MRITVAGTGYVGLVTGVCLAAHGHHVTCVDTDKNKIEKMKKGICPIYEPGLQDLMQEHKESLIYTTDYASAYQDSDVIFIGVGTPEKKDGSANLSYVYTVTRQIAESVVNDCVIVIKSTVPVGTNERIEKLVRETAPKGIRIYVASNPEFLAQGTAVQDTMDASRIVIGSNDEYAIKLLSEIYKGFSAPKIITDRKSAEMIKYASNDFLAVKISYINEIANLCEIVGANIDDVSRGMGLDVRIGNRFLNAGIGYGGSCFPKDTRALHWLANFHEYEIKTIKAAIEVNENQKLKLTKKIRNYYDSMNGLTIAVLGLTFKPGTDDLREAPSLVNIPLFLDDGAKVKAWDPVGEENFKRFYPDELIYCDKIEECLKDADLCVIFTEWNDIRQIRADQYKELMKHAIVLDGRNCYPLEHFKGSGVVYDSMGRPTVR